MNNASALLKDIPDTWAGRQMKWYLGMLLSRGEGSSATDRERYTPEFAPRMGRFESDEQEREGWRGFASRMGEISELSVEPRSEFKIDARLTAAKNRKWRLSVEVEPNPPHRISLLNWRRQFEFKLEVREATEADASILADIERRCPIVLGDIHVHFDRGSDYFAFARLMEDCTIGIASVDGVPAGVSCGAKHRVRIGGVLRPFVTVVHLRVLPEHQRKGLWGAANRILDKYWSIVEGSNAYISVDNAGMQHGFINTPNKWSIPAFRIQLACATLAGLAAGRSATPADAPALVELLNSFHGREEMYVPYTVESLSARLERAPELYSWDKVWMTSGAMVGVWPAGESLRVVSETKGVRTESLRGVVLDYAFGPGAEREFEALLRAWCGWIQERGMDTLSIFTSPSSPGVEILRLLAREIEPYNMWTPGIAEPPDAHDRGLYVDPIYF
jgi:GNAT superfamily N-acetyltransferase